MSMTALILLVAFLLLVSICGSLASYAFFWYENAWRVRFAPDGGAKLRLMVLSGLLSSFVSLTLIMISYPLGLFRRFWDPKEICASGPVIILTHGIYHNASAWLLFRSRLQKAGFKNIFVMNYGSFFTSFEKSIQKFEKFVTDARKAVPDQPVYLIGHSLGGLFSRVYAERAGEGAIPAAVITMGSPHQGSKLAAFSLGKLGSSLLYRGPLFTELECGPPRLPCNGVALFSPVDNAVLPSAAMKAPYPGWVYYETDPLSHTAILYSKSVARKIIEILRGHAI
jgi:triacylglycerol lipase